MQTIRFWLLACLACGLAAAAAACDCGDDDDDDDGGGGQADDDASPSDDDASPDDDDQSPDDDDDDGPAWTIQTIDSQGNVGDYSSLALDAQGKAHVSYRYYYDSAHWNLRYATNASGAWASEDVDLSATCGEYSSIAVDSTGAAHIAYRDYGQGSLRHATNAGGAWALETVDDTGASDGLYASIAVDNADVVHVGYQNYLTPTSTAKYANNLGGVWDVATVDANNDAGMYLALTLDSFNNPRLAYYTYDWTAQTASLMYTAFNGSWSTETVASALAYEKSIACDSFDQALIAFREGGSGAVRLAADAAGLWQFEDIEAGGDFNGGVSLAVAADDSLHVAYHESLAAQSGRLRYATNASGAWQHSTVDDQGDPGYDCSLKLDAQGDVHIAYYEAKSRDLKYATSDPNAGQK